MKKLSKGFETIPKGVEHCGLAVLTFALVEDGLGPTVLMDIDHSELHCVSEARSIRQVNDLPQDREKLP